MPAAQLESCEWTRHRSFHRKRPSVKIIISPQTWERAVWHHGASCGMSQPFAPYNKVLFSFLLVRVSIGTLSGTKQVRLKRYRRCGRCANGGAVRAGNGVWLASKYCLRRCFSSTNSGNKLKTESSKLTKQRNRKEMHDPCMDLPHGVCLSEPLGLLSHGHSLGPSREDCERSSCDTHCC